VESDEDEFRRFAAARMESLRSLAYLTCGDWHVAEDAVSASLAKLYARWSKVSSPERYAARMVVRAAIDEVRRPWRRERAASDQMPELIQPDGADGVVEAVRVRGALRQVPVGQRAVLVLRFFADFTVDEAAEALGRRPGTITSQTARGLATLRRLLADADITLTENIEEGRSDARYARTLADG
jgi:RNA polymerase sigma-70 factor (sigma-E family)